MAGVAPPAGQLLEGKNFAPLLEGRTDFTRGPVFWHYPHYGNQGGQPAAAIRDGDWKLVEFFEKGAPELYNLANDPRERHDLAKAEPERVANMKDQLEQWQQSVGAQFPTKNPDFKPKNNHRKVTSTK
jgi:arylsulfatase A-like enzyme